MIDIRTLNLETLSLSLNLNPREKMVMDGYFGNPQTRAFLKPADIFRQHGMIEESIAVLQEGLVLYPHFTTAKVFLARDYFEMGQVSKAENLLLPLADELVDNILGLKILLKIEILKKNDIRTKYYLSCLENLNAIDSEISSLKEIILEGGVQKASQTVVGYFLEKNITLVTNDSRSTSQIPFNNKSTSNNKYSVNENLNFPQTQTTTQFKSSSSSQLVISTDDSTLPVNSSTGSYDKFQVVTTSEVLKKWTDSGVSISPELLDKQEIEDETLGDLYMEQGKNDLAYAMYKKIENYKVPSEGVIRKMNRLKILLSKDQQTIPRKIAFLTNLLKLVESRS